MNLNSACESSSQIIPRDKSAEKKKILHFHRNCSKLLKNLVPKRKNSTVGLAWNRSSVTRAWRATFFDHHDETCPAFALARSFFAVDLVLPLQDEAYLQSVVLCEPLGQVESNKKCKSARSAHTHWRALFTPPAAVLGLHLDARPLQIETPFSSQSFQFSFLFSYSPSSHRSFSLFVSPFSPLDRSSLFSSLLLSPPSSLLILNSSPSSFPPRSSLVVPISLRKLPSCVPDVCGASGRRFVDHRHDATSWWHRDGVLPLPFVRCPLFACQHNRSLGGDFNWIHCRAAGGTPRTYG